MRDESDDGGRRIDPSDDVPPGGELSRDLSFLLARANAISLAAGNAAMRQFGLKIRAYPVLVMAAEASSPTQREIADLLRLDPSQVVAILDDLEARGLVERRTAVRDRRAKVVVATAQGRKLCEQARVAIGAAESEAFAGLAEGERAQLARLLSRVAFGG